MKIIIQIIAIAAVAFLLSLFLPWWSIAIAAFIGAAVLPTDKNFLSGFVAIFLLWIITALIITSGSSSDLANRVAGIFQVPSWALYLITGVLGGLVAGFAAMAGGGLHKRKKKAKYY